MKLEKEKSSYKTKEYVKNLLNGSKCSILFWQYLNYVTVKCEQLLQKCFLITLLSIKWLRITIDSRQNLWVFTIIKLSFKF
jgi:hypothetical protein